MIEKLKEMFPSSQLQSFPPNHSSDLKWYYDPQEELYMGFKNDDLSQETVNLLNTLFEKWESGGRLNYNHTPLQHAWLELLQTGQANDIIGECHSVRLTFVELSQMDISSTDIEEACLGFFNQAIHIVWLSETSLVLIERDSSSTIQFDDLLAFSKILEADLYTKMKFYLGKPRVIGNNVDIQQTFRRENRLFQKIKTEFPRQSYFTFERIAPSLMIQELPGTFLQLLKEEYSSILEDKELLQTIQVYIENNMNASLTAKKLFMHRNSLLYRIDKFTEKTGLDIKQFESAWIVYFLSLIQE
ncbi:PucR family transcriptional regulator [Bacillus carboniphilus]|uniref:PucR family transcriptional regulator n=1 Tax=Bacillus carboniphilus TaxID=86663 RepID=A0ABP3FWP5_9BACI